MPSTMHAHTPSLQVIDSRGLAVRHTNYHRTLVGERAQARVERRQYDPAARLTATWDPRLSARLDDDPATHPNLANIFSLSDAPLSVESADAGWRVTLLGEAGQIVESWDARDSHWLSEYDEFLRPLATREQASGQSWRTCERFLYADSSGQAAADNLCGQQVRCDDGAGCQQVQACSITGQPLQESRRFLNNLELPDWPEDLTPREDLLEPGAGAATSFTYGPTGETLTQTDAMGNRQVFTYGISGRLAKISLIPKGEAEQLLLHELKYNAFAQIESQTAGNGVASRALFDPADGRLLELIATRKNTERLQHLLYSYDPTGNVIQIEDQTQPTRHFRNQRIELVSRYEHDSLYQLISATGQEIAGATIRPELPELALLPLDTSQLLNYTQHYRYDEAGNLIELRHEGAQPYTRSMVVDTNSNRTLTWSEGEAPPDFSTQFDANGNLQTLTAGQPLRWDVRNQLLEVKAMTRTVGADDSERYAYDATGMRLRKTATAQAKTVQHTREVRYLPGLEIRTDSATGERLEVISLQAGRTNVRHLHWVEGKPDAIANNQLRYSVDDHLSSSALELDNEARLISHEGYYPFGGTAWWAARSVVEAKYKVIRYSGKERDTSGLYYYGLRYYAPWLLRWINPDPAGSAFNGYRMVENGPMNRVDVLGLEGTDVTSGLITIGVIIASALFALGAKRYKTHRETIEAQSAFLAGKQYQYKLTDPELKKLSVFITKWPAFEEEHFEFSQGSSGQIHAYYLGAPEHHKAFEGSGSPSTHLTIANNKGIPYVDLRGKQAVLATPHQIKSPAARSLDFTPYSAPSLTSALERATYRKSSVGNPNKRVSIDKVPQAPLSTHSSPRTSISPIATIGDFFSSRQFKLAEAHYPNDDLRAAVIKAVERLNTRGKHDKSLHKVGKEEISLDLLGVGGGTGRGGIRLLLTKAKKGQLWSPSRIGDTH